jgi:hypothetical protein
VLVEYCNAFRPRGGPANRNTVRLRPEQVVTTGVGSGGKPLGHIGAFFLGMSTYRAVPSALLPVVSKIDRALAALMPRLCARSYVLFKAPASQA